MWVTFIDGVCAFMMLSVCTVEIIVSVTLCCVLCVQDGTTALYYASRKGHDEVVRVLLAANATVNTQPKVLFVGCFQSKSTSIIFSENLIA